MNIPCSGHAHRIEFTISSEPSGWHRVEDRFGVFGRIPTRMEVRLFLIIDGRSLGYSLPGDSVRQDSNELLRGLYQLILSSFESLPPCLKGNANGWAMWSRDLLQEMGRFRIDPNVARQFQNALALLVSGLAVGVASSEAERRQIEHYLALRALPVDTVDEELLRLMEQNREAIAREFMLPPDEFRQQYQVNWDVAREVERDMTDAYRRESEHGDAANETAKALFEKMMPWAAEQLNRDNQIVLDTCPSRLKYVFWRNQYDQIRIFDGNPALPEAYRGWLCLEVNAPDHIRVPAHDRLLQRLLLLQRDEKQVWQIAYFHSGGSQPSRELMLKMGGRPYRLDSDRLPPVRYDGPVRYEPMTENHSHPSMQDILHRAITGEWPDGA